MAVVEFLPPLTLLFALLGCDVSFENIIVFGFLTIFLSCLPKKFIFRNRPYMDKRAHAVIINNII